MSDLVYSTTLLVAVVVSIAVAIWNFAALVRRRRIPVQRIVWAGAAAAAFGAVSFLVHLRFGHAPASPEPMTLQVFIGHHPAYLTVAAALAVAAVCGCAASRRPPREDPLHRVSSSGSRAGGRRW